MKQKISRFEYAIMKIADPIEAEKHEPYTEQEEIYFREQKLLATAKLMVVKKWMKLSEVLKEFKCGYKDLIVKASLQKVIPNRIENELFFFRDDLEKEFEYRTKRNNGN